MAVSAACRSPPRGSEGTGRTRARAGFAGPECQSSRLCARTVFSWSRQCRQPAPLAPWRRASAPRAGAVRLRRGYAGDRAVGAAVPPDRAVGSLLTRVRPTSRGRARCVSFRRGAAVGSDGERPTSRGRSPAARWATLPCPAGQGTLPGCGGDAVCPAGKGAAEWRAGSLAYHGGKQGIKAFSPSGEFTGAPGSGAVARCPAKDGDACPPQMERALLPATPSASSSCGKRGALQARLTAIAFSRRTSGACTQHRLPSPAKSQRFALPAPVSFPNPSRRENGGLCPHPLKGPDP